MIHRGNGKPSGDPAGTLGLTQPMHRTWFRQCSQEVHLIAGLAHACRWSEAWAGFHRASRGNERDCAVSMHTRHVLLLSSASATIGVQIKVRATRWKIAGCLRRAGIRSRLQVVGGVVAFPWGCTAGERPKTPDSSRSLPPSFPWLNPRFARCRVFSSRRPGMRRGWRS